jgi:hypothetical protein
MSESALSEKREGFFVSDSFHAGRLMRFGFHGAVCG